MREYYKELYGDKRAKIYTCIWKCEDGLWTYFCHDGWVQLDPWVQPMAMGNCGPSTYPNHISLTQMSKEETFIELL